VSPPRAADDFATIKGRLEELRRERELTERAETGLPSEPSSPGDSSDPIAIRRLRDAAGCAAFALLRQGAKPIAFL